MIMAVIVIVVMVVIAVMMVAATVRASFGSEGRAREGDVQPQAAHEVVEHVIVLVGEAAGRDLERHVPIAEVVRRAREEERVVGGRDAEILVGGDDRIRLAVVGEQAVAVHEHRAARQADGNLSTILQVRAKSRFLAGVVSEDEPAGDGSRRVVVEATDGVHGQNKKYR